MKERIDVTMTFAMRSHLMLAEVFKGSHHVHGETYNLRDASTTCLVRSDGMSTTDNDILTRLVFAAHDYCLRVSLKQAGPHNIKIVVTCRKREGDWSERHPSLEEAVDKWKKR